MALGIQTGGEAGDFLPRIQYDARAGRFFRVDRVQNDTGEWLNDMEEMPFPIRVVVDMDNIEVGWMKFENGVDFQMVRVGEPYPPQPSDKHRRGFRAKIYNKALGVRLWNHSAKCVIKNFDALHDEWKAQRSDHRGDVPVVAIDKTVAIVSGSGTQKSTNYAPVLTISEWIKRPAALDEPETKADYVPPPQEAVAAKPATNGAAQAPVGQEF